MSSYRLSPIAPAELWVAREEALTLPRLTQNAFFEDVLLDSLIANLGDVKCKSIEDSRLFCESKLKAWVQMDAAAIASNAIQNIATKLLLYSYGQKIPEDSKVLSKLLKASKINTRNIAPYVVISHADVQQLTLRIPKISLEEENSSRNFSLYLGLASAILGVKYENITVVMDPDLGSEFLVPGPVQKLIDSLTLSARDPKGLFLGPSYNFPSGFKGNLPHMLYAMRILASKGEYVRKRTPVNARERVDITTFKDLMGRFNILSGLNAQGNGFSVQLLKNLLNVSVKPINRTFPGGWISSTRLYNGAKSDISLLYKMGYSEIIPSTFKTLDTIFNDVVTKPSGKLEVSNYSTLQDRDARFIEFRTGLSLIAAKIDPKSDLSFDKQLSIEPLDSKNPKVLKSWKDPKYFPLVDALNVASALRASISNPKSKTQPVHYKQAREHLLHLSSKVPLKDGAGIEYHTISDMPTPLVEYARKKFRFPKKETKRTAEPIEDSSGKKARTEQSSVPTVTREAEMVDAPAPVLGSVKDRRSGKPPPAPPLNTPPQKNNDSSQRNRRMTQFPPVTK